jgi:hypothetical protein
MNTSNLGAFRHNNMVEAGLMGTDSGIVISFLISENHTLFGGLIPSRAGIRVK